MTKIYRQLKNNIPIFFPDATLGVSRSIDSVDLKNAGIKGVVVNTYHLMSRPGDKLIKELGGIKKFMNWEGITVSDSGGFQLLSLIYKNPKLGRVTDNGVVIYQGKLPSRFFTPEKSIQVQFNLRSDIMICFDDCSAVNSSHDDYILSINRTVEWAKRCKEEYSKQIKNTDNNYHPILFAVIQGGDDKKLRERCAKELIKIGFDGYCFGGWPMDKNGRFNNEIFEYTCSLMPKSLPKFALGIGDPSSIVNGWKVGYQLFDCVLPTRDARHRRLYIFNREPEKINFSKKGRFYDYLYFSRKFLANDTKPISEFCDCHTCLNFSRAYLHHLFQINDVSALRLATIHNLRFYSKLTELLKN